MTFLTFCPTCANLLLVGAADGVAGTGRLFCQACPYEYTLKGRLEQEAPLARKEVDDVLGGDEAWASVDRTKVQCPECGGPEAYFMQIQTRSADEPASIFYKCCTCGHRWRDG